MSHIEREHLYVNKWLTVAACSVLQLSAGLPYSFGIFGAELKRTFGWSQAELAAFGTALNLGAFASFIPGFLFAALKRFESGPRRVTALPCTLSRERDCSSPAASVCVALHATCRYR